MVSSSSRKRMTDLESVVKSFYEAFANRDAEAMVRCYADDVIFHDPVFGELHGGRARDMWRMLAARATDLRIEVSNVRSSDPPGTVTAHWEAWYTFSGTGRKVHNVIDASFVVARDRGDPKITRHTDRFDL